jgi:HAD superfamily hydrolase (TIGR01509 family)
MSDPRVIFFDVGNTLLFPNRTTMLAPLPSGAHPSLEQWRGIERKTKREFDDVPQSDRVDHGFWWMFHTHLIAASEIAPGSSTDEVLKALVRNTQNSANWDQILPGTREALDRIRRHHRIAVISNADGRIAEVLTRCGIADCFETITDSGLVGHEKPHPAIFEAALRSMQARPEESVYVGDMYSVDYLGALNAGMQAVLFDVAGAHQHRDVPRVESLEQLEAWLRR